MAVSPLTGFETLLKEARREPSQAGAQPGFGAPCSVAEEGARLREELLLKPSLAVVDGEDSQGICWLFSTVKGRGLKPCPGWAGNTD